MIQILEQQNHDDEAFDAMEDSSNKSINLV